MDQTQTFNLFPYPPPKPMTSPSARAFPLFSPIISCIIISFSLLHLLYLLSSPLLISFHSPSSLPLVRILSTCAMPCIWWPMRVTNISSIWFGLNRTKWWLSVRKQAKTWVIGCPLYFSSELSVNFFPLSFLLFFPFFFFLSFFISFLLSFLPSFLPYLLTYLLTYLLDFLPSFLGFLPGLPSFLDFLPLFLDFFPRLPSFLPSFLSFLPCFLPSLASFFPTLDSFLPWIVRCSWVTKRCRWFLETQLQ